MMYIWPMPVKFKVIIPHIIKIDAYISYDLQINNVILKNIIKNFACWVKAHATYLF